MPVARSGPFIARSSWLIGIAVVAVNLLQSPGKITFDTKLDLLLRPGSFLADSLHLWNSSAAFGGLQNQASGFLFPIGPWFWVMHETGVPVWLSERLWSALLMLVAYFGMRRLASAWGLPGRGAVVAALGYMLAPRMLTTIGVLSGEVVPQSVLPWTVLPIVLYLRGRWTPARAVILSTASVPFMGGHNATEVLASLVAPLVVLLLSDRGPQWRLTAVWGSLVFVVSMWWLVPLLLLSRYGPPFLDYIESATNTMSSIGWLASLRGTSHWVPYLGTQASGWDTGFALVSSPTLLVVSTAVALGGVLGLLHSRLPDRRALLICLLLGLALLTFGSSDVAGSPARETWRNLFDGSLAPFRNIHKFDPVVRLPLALGLGVATASAGDWLEQWIRRLGKRPVAGRIRARSAWAAVVGALVLVVAQPAFVGQLRDDKPFDAIPSYWTEAAHYLSAMPRDSRVLVVPGSGFAVQTWGRTQDEVLQALDVVPFAVRNQVPLSTPGLIRTLDSIEAVFESGRPSPGLVDLLRRIGVTELVVRNDLDPQRTDAPSPSQVHAVLGGSTGLRRERSFGHLSNGFPGVEILAVEGDNSGVSLTPMRAVVHLTGGPEAIRDALDTGILPQHAATLAGTNPGSGLGLLADTYPRVERTFGRVHQAATAPMTASEPFHLHRPVHDYVLPQEPQTFAKYGGGLTSVTASSSAGYADTFGPVRAPMGPHAALDGSVFTAWHSAPLTAPVGQWIELDFDKARVIPSIAALFDSRLGAGITRVSVDVDGGRVDTQVSSDGETGRFSLPATPTRRLRLTVTGVDGAGDGSVALAELAVTGLDPDLHLDLPGALGVHDSLLLTSPPGALACLVQPGGAACDGSRGSAPAEAGGSWRTFRVAQSGSWHLGGTAVATSGSDLARLFQPLGRRQVQVTGSSWYGGEVVSGPWHALDGDPGTSWVSGIGDSKPVLDLHWGPRRTISRIRVVTFSGRAPGAVTVSGGGRTQSVRLGNGSLGIMTPVQTRHLRLRFTGPDGAPLQGSISVAELRLNGLGNLVYRPDPSTPTGARCGFGPEVVVDGRVVPTQVHGTLDSVENGGSLDLESCGGPVVLSAGESQLRVADASGFAVSALTLTPRDAPTKTSQGRARIISSSASDRDIRVMSKEDAVLALPQDVNEGWQATLDGKGLNPVTVDGWRQGWIVPAHSDGVVRMHYAPQELYEIGLALGGIGVFAVWFAALLFLCRGAGARSAAEAAQSPEPVLPRQWAGPRQGVWQLGWYLSTLALFVVSPPLAAGFAFTAWLRWLDRRRVAVVASTLIGVAATLAAARLGASLRAPAVADVLVALAIGMCAAATWRSPEDAASRARAKERS